MTRRAQTRPQPSFSTAPRSLTDPRHPYTAIERPDQPSAWSRGLLYGGGLSLAALALAGSFAGPRPKRRTPPVPEPAWVRVRPRD